MPRTPESIADRWKASTSSGTAKQKYIESMDDLKESPTERAATEGAMERYLRNIEESVRSGKRARKLRAVTLEAYKRRAKEVGAERLGSGATANVGKVRDHFRTWLPVYNAAKAMARDMPKSNLEEAMARVRAVIEMFKQQAEAGRG